MLKTLTREKTRIVIGRKLKRSVDAMYGLATRLGVMKPQPQEGGRGGDTPEQNDRAKI
jgi:hypothetical protein